MAPKPTDKNAASVGQPATAKATASAAKQPAKQTTSVAQSITGGGAVAASVAQPAAGPPVYLPLRELTDRSARIAQLKLSVFHPWEDQYSYTWDGQERSGTIFRCLLVDTEDPKSYCHAEYKKPKPTKTHTNAPSNSSLKAHALSSKTLGS